MMTPEERADKIMDGIQEIQDRPMSGPAIFIYTRHMIIDEVKSIIAEATRWIPVSERLPMHGDEVLAFDSSRNQWTAFRDTDSTWWVETLGDGYEQIDNITHWMPLPAGPEGG
jgi:hypothetical protein